tara:strand:+ start:266 stop:814 length:549 start_codon:yes stop_codon:yes gene_type:complete
MIKSVLAWMDLEMTGLNPKEDVIVEIATLLTNDDLEEIAAGPNLVIHQSAKKLENMSKHVEEMHTSSGLLDEISKSIIDLSVAGERTLDFLKDHIEKAGTVPLCGNSIGTDRRFLSEGLPDLASFFHYRSIDVSTIKELAKRWNPEIINSAPKKNGGHRALDDIRESVAELRHYRENLFIKP